MFNNNNKKNKSQPQISWPEWKFSIIRDLVKHGFIPEQIAMIHEKSRSKLSFDICWVIILIALCKVVFKSNKCMLWFVGSQRVRHDWATELNWTEVTESLLIILLIFFFQDQTLNLKKKKLSLTLKILCIPPEVLWDNFKELFS